MAIGKQKKISWINNTLKLTKPLTSLLLIRMVIKKVAKLTSQVKQARSRVGPERKILISGKARKINLLILQSLKSILL